MWIGRKTKGPARLALKIIVETILERGLWPQPLLRLLLFYIIVLLLFTVVFFGAAAGIFQRVGMVLFNRNHIKWS